MRTPVDFEEYRAWFYFFQYQFFVRSLEGKRRELPKSRLAQFLFSLAEDSHPLHYRWELKHNIQLINLRRKQRASDPVPLTMGTGIRLFRAKRKSVRCRYMLMAFPDRHRADHIPLLYKALITFDMLQRGISEYAATKQIITQAETLPSLSRLRSQSIWYDALFDYSIGMFEWSYLGSGHAIENYAMRFMATSRKDHTIELKGERDSQHDPIRSRVNDVKRYKKIADELISLAQTGQFKKFPTRIARIK